MGDYKQPGFRFDPNQPPTVLFVLIAVKLPIAKSSLHGLAAETCTASAGVALHLPLQVIEQFLPLKTCHGSASTARLDAT